MSKKQLEQLSEELLKGNKCLLISQLKFEKENKGLVIQKELIIEEQVHLHQNQLVDRFYEEMSLALNSGVLKQIMIDNDHQLLIEPFFPKARLLIFGGGHIAVPLSEFAKKVGFSPLIYDDRIYFANETRFPDADQVICDSFDKVLDRIEVRKSDFIVLITRGHKYDRDLLRKLIDRDVVYFGMIGSKRRVAGLKKQLVDEGYDQERLNRLNAPIGVEIGAITPEEIAVSITAELISYKNKFGSASFNKQVVFPEFEHEIVKNINSESQMPKALFTILSSKGSVPRKAGAKMLAFYDGRTFGSIGGGCSESDLITKSRDMSHDTSFFIERVNMTGDVAEDEGMVCGGMMDVLVERI